jgi:hypothetical protein
MPAFLVGIPLKFMEQEEVKKPKLFSVVQIASSQGVKKKMCLSGLANTVLEF